MAQNTALEQADHEAEQASLVIHQDPAPIRIDKGGAVRVGKTRVTLETVMHSFKGGDSPEDILDSFPTLQLADIYSVIGYYLRHTEEVDEFLRQGEIEAERIRQKIEAYQNSAEFRARLAARRAQEKA
jgi:uncharacterized protein (DUF433 family)